MGQEYGKLYQNGMDLYYKKNYTEALTNFRAEGAHAPSLFMLGEHHHYGHGLSAPDKKQALDYYLKSHNLGYVPATKKLGDYYLTESEFQDYKEAIKYYTIAFEKGNDPLVGVKLGEMLYDGLGIQQDYKRAYDIFNSAHSKKLASSDVVFKLGKMNLEGLGIVRNYDAAVQYFVDAYVAGNLDGVVGLGELLVGAFIDSGKLADVLFHSIMTYVNEHTENSHEPDQLTKIEEFWRLFFVLDKEKKLTNYQKSKKYFETAAGYGHADAIYKLGINMITEPEETDKDKGLTYLHLADDKGHKNAAYMIGYLMYYGRYIKKDKKRSLEYFKRAHERGIKRGTFMVGLLISEDESIEQNYLEAIKYFDMAIKDKNDLDEKIFHAYSYLISHDPQGIEKVIKMAEQKSLPAMFYLAENYWGRPEEKFRWTVELYKIKIYQMENLNKRYMNDDVFVEKLFDLYYDEYKVDSKIDPKQAILDFENKTMKFMPKFITKKFIALYDGQKP